MIEQYESDAVCFEKVSHLPTHSAVTTEQSHNRPGYLYGVRIIMRMHQTGQSDWMWNLIV